MMWFSFCYRSHKLTRLCLSSSSATATLAAGLCIGGGKTVGDGQWVLVRTRSTRAARTAPDDSEAFMAVFSCQRPATVVVAPLEALPRGPGFDPPRGRISALGLKKLPRLSHVQSTVEPGLTHKATGPRVRVGQGFGGFLGLLWEGHSTSQTMPWGRSHPPQVKFFLDC